MSEPKRTKRSLTAIQKIHLATNVKKARDTGDTILTDETHTSNDLRAYFAKQLGLKEVDLPMSTLQMTFDAWEIDCKRKAKPTKSAALIKAEARIKQLEEFVKEINDGIVPNVPGVDIESPDLLKVEAA